MHEKMFHLLYSTKQKKKTQILGGPIVIFSSHPQDKPKNFAMKRKAEILILAGKKGNW